mgnify:CR=1 FL=1
MEHLCLVECQIEINSHSTTKIKSIKERENKSLSSAYIFSKSIFKTIRSCYKKWNNKNCYKQYTTKYKKGL